MILVTGATGHLGKATLNFLVQQTNLQNVVAFVRDTAKATDLAAKGIALRVGDFNDKNSLVAAFAGVETLFLVSSSDLNDRLQQHLNAIEAAKTAGVKRIVYTSFYHDANSPKSLDFIAASHVATEEAIVASGLDYTILRNTLYADVLPMFIGENVIQTGAVFLPAGNGRVAYATREDMAEASAKVLLQDTHSRKTYLFTSDTLYSTQDVADILSDLSGKKIAYISPTQDVYQAELSKLGVPAPIIGMVCGFGQAISDGAFDGTSDVLASLLGRKPTDLRTYLKAAYQL